MSQSDGKRRIKIQKLNLDPLSNWFYSRREIGDINGVKLDAPDRQLVRTPLLPLPGQPSNTKETYTINQGVDTENFIYSSLRSNSDQASQVALYTFANKYSYINPTPGPQQEKIYSSFSRQIIRNLLNTADKVFASEMMRGRDSFLRNRTYSFTNTLLNIEEFTNSGAAALLQALDANESSRVRLNGVILNQEQEGSLQAFFIEAFNGRIRLTSGLQELSLHRVIYGIINDLSGARYNTGQNKEEVIKIAKFLLLKSLLDTNIITKEKVFSLMNRQAEYSYEYSNVHTSTPYVKTPQNTRELSNFQYENPTDTPSKIKSVYGFYEEGYENNIETDEIQENLLPNMYVRHYYQQADQINQQALSEARRTQHNRTLLEYRDILTLTDTNNQAQLLNSKGEAFYNELISSIESGPSQRFYNSYTELLDPENPTYTLASDELLEKNSKFLVGQLQMLFRGLPSLNSAMGLDVSFRRDTENSDFASYIRSLNTTFDPSLAMIENLSSFTENQQQIISKPYLYSTEYFFVNTQYESPVLNVNLNTFGVEGENAYVINNVPENYSSTVLQKNPLFPTQDDMRRAKDFLRNNKNRRVSTRFSSILNGDQTTSEVLVYRLRKRPANSNAAPQEFFIGNAGQAHQVYKDTQVKYGVEYTYDLTEYRFIYGVKYNTFTISTNIPTEIVMGYLGLGDQDFVLRGLRSYPTFTFENSSYIQPVVELVEVPVYDEVWNRRNVFEQLPQDSFIPFSLGLASRRNLGAGGIAYPKAKVLDLPPTAPTIQFFPRAFVDNQIDVSINPTSGKVGTIIAENGTFDISQKIISIGDNEEKLNEIKQFQDVQFEGSLPDEQVRYKYKGQAEIRNITFYRTTSLNLDVDDYNDLYPSFNPDTSDNVLVRKYSTKFLSQERFGDITRLLSYDLRDAIQPNVNYYYTCIVEDVHGNISNPSKIYRVRLLSENGMVIPEISSVMPKGSNRKRSDKNLARYVQIDASNIQTFPFVTNEDGNVANSRSLGVALNKKLEDQSYIVRLTSKDTGRKFDLKLNFVVRVNGVAQ